MLEEAAEGIKGIYIAYSNLDYAKKKSSSKKKSKQNTKGNDGLGKNDKEPDDEDRMLGKKGTKVYSEITWENGKTERIDVENPAPGRRPGQIHYQEPNNTKWYFNIEEQNFYNEKTLELAPRRVQKLLKNPKFQKGIDKALDYLNEPHIFK